MSTIVCAISGHAPEEPVFSPVTGYVYEKRLVSKHVESAGKCPVSKRELTLDDLVDVRVNRAVRPRPASATSIPGMLALLQGEWDAVMTETYELKTHLETTRKQLSHALYQHDAACRVIARLLRERDTARAQATALQEQLANAGPGAADAGPVNDQAETGLTPDMIQRMLDCAKGLSRTRKQKHFPGLATKEELPKLSVAGSHPIHQSTAPGILCLDVHKADESRIVTGGVDQQVILFDAAKGKMAQKLLGHSKKVSSVLLHPSKEVVISASHDSTVRIWNCTDSADWRAPYSCAHVVRKHEAEITDLSLHPLGDIFSTSSRDKSWALHDLTTGRLVRHLKELESGFGCMKFHPDGIIIAGGTENKTVALWDIKDQVSVATLTGHEGDVEALSFSENGYYLATGARDGAVKLWDLRKPLNIQTLQVCDGPVTSVKFDGTGQYLAVGTGVGPLQIYHFESKASLALNVELKDHTAAVTGICWGQHAKTLTSVSMDRTLKEFKIS